MLRPMCNFHTNGTTPDEVPIQLNAARPATRHNGLAGVLALAALACSSGAAATDHKSGTAQDLYVGCQRLIQNPAATSAPRGVPPADSAVWCALTIEMVKNRGSGKAYSGGTSGRFCLPEHLQRQTDPITALARTYLAYYEKAAGRLADADGATTIAAAMVDKWPCSRK